MSERVLSINGRTLPIDQEASLHINHRDGRSDDHPVKITVQPSVAVRLPRNENNDANCVILDIWFTEYSFAVKDMIVELKLDGLPKGYKPKLSPKQLEERKKYIKTEAMKLMASLAPELAKRIHLRQPGYTANNWEKIDKENKEQEEAFADLCVRLATRIVDGVESTKE